MGCDIHAHVEIKKNDKWEYIKEVFDMRHYGLFGWLADVRNYSDITPLDTVTKGIPEDLSQETRENLEYWNSDDHSHHYVSLKALLDVNYSQIILDRRVTRQTSPNSWDGRCTTDDPNEATAMKLEEFLGKYYMNEIEELKTIGDPENIRIVFWFDN